MAIYVHFHVPACIALEESSAFSSALDNVFINFCAIALEQELNAHFCIILL